MRSAVTALVAACLLSLAAACAGGPPPQTVSDTGTPSGQTPPRTAFPMPPTTQSGDRRSSQGFTLLDNRRMRLTDYLGHVVVLDFWATYCPPCLEEAPHLDALQRRYGAEGLHVVGLNVGGADDRPKIPEFVEQFKIKYTLGIPDAEMTSFYLAGDDRIPQTLVFDRQGRLVKHFVGYDETVSTELERAIQTSLAAGTEEKSR